MATKGKVAARRKRLKRGDQTAANYRKFENVGLAPSMDIDDLVLNWTDETLADLEVKGALVGLEMARTIEGGSTVTLTLRDPDYLIFSEKAKSEAPWASREDRRRNQQAISQARRRRAHQARVLAKKRKGKKKPRKTNYPEPLRVDDGWNPIMPPERIGETMGLTVDGVPFALVKVSHTWSTRETVMTFEDFAAMVLKRRKGAKRVKRSLMTRAQFIKSLCDEALLPQYGYRYMIPELNVIQPIEGGSKQEKKRAGAKASGHRVLYIGDSLGVGTVPQLKRKAAGKFGIDQDVKTSMNSDWGWAQLQAKLTRKHYAVVFDMGTNDVGSWAKLSANLNKVYAKVKPRNLIVASMNGQSVSMNANLRSWAQGKPEVGIVDWHELCQSQNIPLDSMGIHPGPDGYKKRADLFMGAIPVPTAASASALDPPGVSLLAASSGSSSRSRSSSDDGEGGFPPGAKITIKGTPCSKSQRNVIAEIIGEAFRCGASAGVAAAAVAACMDESTCQVAAVTTGDDDAGLFQQGRNWIELWATKVPARACNAFLLAGAAGHSKRYKSTSAHGGPGWLKSHGSLKSFGGMSFTNAIHDVQGNQVAGVYAPFEASARHAVSVYRGGPGADATGGDRYSDVSTGTTRTKAYMFARNEDENSWGAIGRLAQEVNWRFFVSGKSIYYMSQERLYGRAPRYIINADQEGLLELTYDLDWGKAVSTAELTATLDQWGAAPGSIVMLDGFGPPDGRWLVAGLQRSWYDVVGTVSLVQPGKKKLEPAAEKVSGTVTLQGGRRPSSDGSPGGESVDRGGAYGKRLQAMYAEAVAISKKNMPYTWGGGHGSAGVPTDSGHRPVGRVGFDCSGYVCAVLRAGGFWHPGDPIFSDSMGSVRGSKSGVGRYFTVWGNGSHTFMQFEEGMGDLRYKRADTSYGYGGGGGHGPHVRTNHRPTGGFHPFHWPP